MSDEEIEKEMIAHPIKKKKGTEELKRI